MKPTRADVMSGRALRRQAQRDTASERSERALRHGERVANVGAELVDSEPTTLQGQRRAAFSGTVEDGDGQLLPRVYADGTLLYQLIYAGRDIDAEAEDVAAFFDSFRFTEER